ncbi:hypothetical protein GCM10023220_06020 [Streptomyces ziwulingensis]|uniref:Uncharacterized protein n=1 Tax=Streptomyces ziwulingensis TaxID=1045501 RepID=A0ABP9AT25_9ACTN
MNSFTVPLNTAPHDRFPSFAGLSGARRSTSGLGPASVADVFSRSSGGCGLSSSAPDVLAIRTGVTTSGAHKRVHARMEEGADPGLTGPLFTGARSPGRR